MNKSIGQTNYEAYVKEMGGQANGDPFPEWQELSIRERRAWMLAARTVLFSYEKADGMFSPYTAE